MRIGAFVLSVCAIASGILLGSNAAFAAHVPPSTLMKACTFDSDADRALCEAFYRGSMELFEVGADSSKFACRPSPVTPEDIQAFVVYSGSHMIADTGEGFALVLNYLGSGKGMADHLPCNNVIGNWTNAHLLDLCEKDNSGGSPCKFYETPLLQAVQLQEATQKQQFFCPSGATDRSDDEVLAYYRDWLKANPDKQTEPAALGFIAALEVAYPCPTSPPAK